MGSNLTKCVCGTEDSRDHIPNGTYLYQQVITADELGICIQLGTRCLNRFCPISTLALKWCDIEFVKLDEGPITMICYMKDGDKVKIYFEDIPFSTTSIEQFRGETSRLKIFFKLSNDVEKKLGSKSNDSLFRSYALLNRAMPYYYVPRRNVPNKQATKNLYKKVIADQIREGEVNLAQIREILRKNGISVGSNSITDLLVAFQKHKNRSLIPSSDFRVVVFEEAF